jgi:dethiobiotin synthetase
LKGVARLHGDEDDLSDIVPYVFESPLAPALAAEREGRRISIRRIMSAFKRLSSRHELVIVESAGGLLAPITARYFYADLAARLALPAIVVAGAHLGTINHTLLTLQCAERAGIKVIGVVMDHVSPEEGLAEATNAAALRRWARVPFLGELPFLPRVNVETIREAIKRSLDMEGILATIE